MKSWGNYLALSALLIDNPKQFEIGKLDLNLLLKKISTKLSTTGICNET